MTDSIPPVPTPAGPHPLVDIMSKLAPALILAVAGWALTLEVRTSLHEQRLVNVEQRATTAETEARLRSDRMTAALEAQREQIAELRATVAGLAQQVQALTRAIDRLQTPAPEAPRPAERRR